jgi:hypothetical protein
MGFAIKAPPHYFSKSLAYFFPNGIPKIKVATNSLRNKI